MKFSRNWLTAILGQTFEQALLTAKLTLAGLEVEACESVAKPFTDVVIGLIERCEPHPNADRLKVTYINVGVPELLQVVCGASNARVGLKVAVALCGAKLGTDLNIKQSKLRGVESQGMCCSSAELGLLDNSDGIIELPNDAPLGVAVREYLDLDDVIITLGITPNRGDCLSLAGLARETAAIFDIDYVAPTIPSIAAQHSQVPVIRIEHQEACPHYAGRIIRNINLQATTPIWLQQRLQRSGIRPLEPVIDVTHYVMLELGQPLHAFDWEQIDGEIVVRNAQQDENLLLLNGEQVTLDPRYLVVADQQQVLAIAGIMGGKASSVTTTTQHILLESAYFTPAQLANRARWLGLNTEAAYRFERRIDPALTITALERATELLLAIVGGEPGPIQAVPQSYVPSSQTVVLKKYEVSSLLGISLEDTLVVSILQRLGIYCLEEDRAQWTFAIPSHRSDIRLGEDLIEEIVRIYGYDKIPTTIPCLPLAVCGETQAPLAHSCQQLCDLGYQEVITYSFVDGDLQHQLEPELSAITLRNPIAADLNVMRTSLLTGLVTAALYNQRRQQQRGQLFEMANCFHQDPQSQPRQVARLAGIRWGIAEPSQWGKAARECDFFDIKGDVETILQSTLPLENIVFTRTTHPSLHSGRSATIMYGSQQLGLVGQLHPQVQLAIDAPYPLFYFELDIEAIGQKKVPIFQEISKFPSIRRDLAIIIPQEILAQDIIHCVKAAAGDNLVTVHIFDLYTDKAWAGKKSIALSLVWQDQAQTLIDEIVNQYMSTVLQSLRRDFNAILRE